MTSLSLAPEPAELAWSAPRTGVAVIGCGYWGGNYVRVFEALTDSAVLVVCDARPEALDDVARHFPHVRTTSSLDEALAVPGVDAAVVVTMATSHFEVTRRIIEAGKHVLVEKPLTTDAATARALVELSRERGVVLLVGHTFLYNGAVHTVKEHVDPDDVYYLYAQRTSLGPIRHDVNAAWDLAPHDISIFDYLLGSQPEWASALGRRLLRNAREDVAFITLGYPGGILGHIHVSWADPNKVRQVVVVSSERRIVFDDLDPLERVRIFDKGVKAIPTAADEQPADFGEHLLQLRDGSIVSPHIPPSEPLKNQCGHFLHCIRRGEQVLTPPEQGLSVVATMEAIDRSLSSGGVPVKVETT